VGGERKRTTSITNPDSNKSLLLLALGGSGSTASPVRDKNLLQIFFAKPESHTARSERIETVRHIIVAQSIIQVSSVVVVVIVITIHLVHRGAMVKVMVSMGMWMTRFARGRLAVVVLNVDVVIVVFIYPIVVVRQLWAAGEKGGPSQPLFHTRGQSAQDK
jgi:hypothetical protein